MITTIATAAVDVTDQPSAVDFWTRQVGFVVHRTQRMGPHASWIEVGPPGAASCIVLYPKSMMSDWTERKPSIVFRCDDVWSTHRQLAANGVSFSQPPQPMPWGDFAIFEDPDGNSYGLRTA
jgi:predicted enzyme related to lactoylglutathione lyase